MEFGLKHLIVVVLLAALAWWAVTKLSLPKPIPLIVEIVCVLVVAFAAIDLLFGGVNDSSVTFR